MCEFELDLDIRYIFVDQLWSRTSLWSSTSQAMEAWAGSLSCRSRNIMWHKEIYTEFVSQTHTRIYTNKFSWLFSRMNLMANLSLQPCQARICWMLGRVGEKGADNIIQSFFPHCCSLWLIVCSYYIKTLPQIRLISHN